ncbi:hypothetical protein BK144_21095 [Paenibacillus sp. FSL R7-0273]|nr:hypothetical protein BK144_21095 [Paenibacillus sp. FSL R7-0273]
MVIVVFDCFWDCNELAFKNSAFILCLNIPGGGSRFQVQKWGNSLGIRIPKSATLDDILSWVTPGNLHKEVSTGEQQGREIW